MGRLSLRKLYEGFWREGSWNLKDKLSKALEMGICFYTCPAFREHGGTLLT
jgi:hypothetical protein